MASPSRQSAKLRFGTFEVDPATFRLLKAGIPIRLPPQPFKVLLLLLERAGEVVNRGEIQQHLWGSSTFVDFERGINLCINQIRAALCDNAETPHYIETLPRVGYRFIAPLHGEKQIGPDLAEAQSRCSSAGSVLQEIGESRPRLFRRFFLLFGATPYRRWEVMQARKMVVVLGTAICVGAIAFLVGLYLRPKTTGAVQSLAVAPFVNVTADPNLDYLSDGITESLIDGLSQLPNLTVRPRGSSFHYKGKDTDIQTIAHELNVEEVLTGRITQHGDSVVVTTELVDAQNNRAVWGKTYEDNVSDVIGLQQEIVMEISVHLRGALTSEQKVRMTKRETADPEAYIWYLKGRYYWERRTPDGLENARVYFTQAIARDPTFVLPYIGLADYWTVAPDYLDIPITEVLPKERAMALQALALDQNSPAAHLALANVYCDNWEWTDAEHEFQRALELDPDFANAHHWYGMYLSWLGRHQEAIAHLRRAVELDPLNLKYNENLALGFQDARQYDLAIAQYNKTISIDPNRAMGYGQLGDMYRITGQYELWLQNWKKMAEIDHRTYGVTYGTKLVAQLSRIYAAQGYPAAVREIVAKRKQQLASHYVDPADMACEYAVLGDKDEAFRWLEKAYTARSRSLQMIKVLVPLDGLRSDPRYTDLLRRLRLE